MHHPTTNPSPLALQQPVAPCDSPDVDLHETSETYILEADMPGVTQEDLNLRVREGVLVLAGQRRHLKATAEARRERSGAGFRRAFILGPLIDTQKITARIEQGVLRVQLPKVEQAKSRQIPVTNA